MRPPVADFLPYVVSKAALIAVARALAKPLGEHEDTAGLVAFLVSDAAGAITGQSLVADGGSTLH